MIRMTSGSFADLDQSKSAWQTKEPWIINGCIPSSELVERSAFPLRKS